MIAIERILVAVDFSKESNLAAKFAVSMAKEYRARLYVLHVYDPLPEYDYLHEDYNKKRMEQLQEELSSLIPDKVKAGLEVQEILVEERAVHHTIVEKAKELGVEVIVIATHGRTGLAHVLVGSVAEHVVRYAPCPVFVIRNPKNKYPYDWG